jgi:hypothetical protein
MSDAQRLRYGPFRLAPSALQFFILLLPVVLVFSLQALHATTVRCQRDRLGVSCAMHESPSGVGGDPFTPASVRSTRKVVQSRSGPHAMGRLVVLDTQGREHQSFDVAHEDALAVANALQRFIDDGAETHFDQSLDQFASGDAAFAVLCLAIALFALGNAFRGSGWAELDWHPNRQRLAVARKYCGLTCSRCELDVAGAASVEIQWFRKHDRHGPGDLFGRLCVATPNGNVFIPAQYARGRRVHMRGAAAVRDLLGLAPMNDELYEPALTRPAPGLAERVGTVVFGLAVGIGVGACFMQSLWLLLGDRSSQSGLSFLWLIAAAAVLGGLVAPRWARQRLDD